MKTEDKFHLVMMILATAMLFATVVAGDTKGSSAAATFMLFVAATFHNRSDDK